MMKECEAADLSNRVVKLERRLRTFQRLTLLLVLGQGVWLMLGAVGPGDQPTRRIALVDHEGRLRIQMETDDEGTPSLKFYDADGKTRIDLGIDDDVLELSYLILSGRKSKTYAALKAQRDAATFILDDEGPNIRMVTSKLERISDIIVEDGTKDAAMARVAAQHDGAFLAFSKGGGQPLCLGVDPDGSADLAFTKDEIERAVLKAAADGTPSLIFRDQDGETIFQKP